MWCAVPPRGACAVRMVRVLHVPTSVARWACPALDALDGALREAGSVPLDPLPWDDELTVQADDPEHFTPYGFAAFVHALVPRALAAGCGGAVLVLTDSTVGHGDWSAATGEWTGAWSDALAAAFAKAGVRATVDAVCGSGFVAGGRDGAHFRARLAAARRRLAGTSACGSVLLVGGWNDAGDPRQERVRAAAAACVALAMRA